MIVRLTLTGFSTKFKGAWYELLKLSFLRNFQIILGNMITVHATALCGE